jgi:hypothetical protein
MSFFWIGFGFLCHALFWGAGLALWLTPRPWRRFWPVFAAPAGLAAQSAVVWWGATSNLSGTDAYAHASLLLPGALLVAGARRLARVVSWEGVRRDVRRFAMLWVVMVVSLAALLFAMSRSTKDLNTLSLGSCDAADYAAGARVLQEFARTDRDGFIGLVEVVQIGSVDNFFEYWRRLNHFTPSALLALNNTLFRLQIHESASVMTAVLVVLTLPMVFWLARAGLRFGPISAGAVSLLYALNPVQWYAVFHVAMAQVIAANAIAMLTVVGCAAWRQSRSGRSPWPWAGLFVAVFWLLLGAYNFILAVAALPAGLFVLGAALRNRAWGRAWRWATLLAGTLLLATIAFWERAAGLLERAQLFQAYDFGWRIPLLTPEGWLGWVADVHLAAQPGPLRAWALVLIVVAIFWGLIRLARRNAESAWLALCSSLPIFVGYGYLQWRGATLGTNASYDAYKLLAVFFPGILAVSCCLLARPGRSWKTQSVQGAFFVAVLAAHLVTAWNYCRVMKSPPLLVDRWITQVKRVEKMPAVASLNILPGDMWSRLWANAFLLRKPQYFANHTYEARRDSPLRGEWDLLSGLISIRLPNTPDGLPDSLDVGRDLTARGDMRWPRPGPTGPGPEEGPLPFSLVDTRSPYFLRASLADGWYDVERLPRAGLRWRWTRGDAAIRVQNPHPYPLSMALRLNVRSLEERSVQLSARGEPLRMFRVGLQRRVVRVPAIEILPGETILEFRLNDLPAKPGAGDDRNLGFAAYGIELSVQPSQEAVSP